MSDDLQAKLIEDLKTERKDSDRYAKRIDWVFRSCRYLAVILGAVASVIGLLAAAPVVHTRVQIEPWMVSLLTLCAGGLEVFRHKTMWRAKADAYFGHRDTLNAIVMKLTYETPHASTEQIAEFSRDFRRANHILGTRLYAINQQDRPGIEGGHPTDTDHSPTNPLT